MPKRISRRPSDVNQAAFQMVQESTQTEDDKLPASAKSEISRVMAEMGRKGGQIGGKRRLETMTKKQRSKIASLAAKARWRAEKKR